MLDSPIAFAALFICAAVYTSLIWALGFKYGAQDWRDRNRAYIKALKDFNDRVQKWSNSASGSVYWEGYANGVSSTLKALYSFLAKYEDKDATPPYPEA
jgi:hypothetical protein